MGETSSPVVEPISTRTQTPIPSVSSTSTHLHTPSPIPLITLALDPVSNPQVISPSNALDLAQIVQIDLGPVNVWQVTWATDSNSLVIASSVGVHIFDTQIFREMNFIKSDKPIYCVAFHPRERIIAYCAGDHNVHLWDIDAGQPIRTFKGHSDTVSSVAFSPDGKYVASGSSDRSVRVWDLSLTSGSVYRVLDTYSEIRSVAFSPDGNMLVSSGYGNQYGDTLIWDIHSGRLIRSFEVYWRLTYSVAFSPDGNTVAAGNQNTQLWDVNSGKLILSLDCDSMSAAVSSVAFSHNGQLLASGCSDGMSLVYQSNTGELLTKLKGTVESIAFAPDGRLLAIGSYDEGTVILWGVVEP